MTPMKCVATREEVWQREQDGEDGCAICGAGHMEHPSVMQSQHWHDVRDELRNDGSYPYRSEVGVYWDDPRDIRSEEP